MRLIDADRLIKDLKNPELVNVFPVVFRVIEEQDTVDAVRVVRCANCRHSRVKNEKLECELFCVYANPYGYCEHGK